MASKKIMASAPMQIETKAMNPKFNKNEYGKTRLKNAAPDHTVHGVPLS